MTGENEKNQSFEQRRAMARQLAKKIQGQFEGVDDPMGWFDKLYVNAGRDAALVPWANLKPHDALASWLDSRPRSQTGTEEGRALDVGCGIGDNAEALSKAGWRVTAFDLSSTAVNWAKERFPGSKVEYVQANLLELPQTWRGSFDFINETYTIQSLQPDIRAAAIPAIAAMLAPGGSLLVICRSRDEQTIADGPPWPIAKSELDAFLDLDLEEVSFETLELPKGERLIPHIRALYRRPC